MRISLEWPQHWSQAANASGYNEVVELASNLLWALVTLALLAGTWRGAHRGALHVGKRSAFTLVALICLLLLPVISVSDDVLEAKQQTLPASAQTWHLASQDASAALEMGSLLFACLTLLQFVLEPESSKPRTHEGRSAYSEWIKRVHSLRPPPVSA